MSIETLNNIIGFSFFGFVVFLSILANIFWNEKERFDKTNDTPKTRTIWILSIIDGFFFLTFLVSLIIKVIKF